MNIAVYTTAQAFLILLITKTAPTGIQLLGLTARFAKDSQLTLNIYSELLVFVCVFFSVLPKSHLRFVHLEPGIKTACLTHLPSVKLMIYFTSQNSATESYAVFLSSRFSEKSLLTPDETRHVVGTISKVCLELRRTK